MRGELSSVWRCPRQEQLELDSVLVWFLLSVPALRAYVCCNPPPVGGLGLLATHTVQPGSLPSIASPRLSKCLWGKAPSSPSRSPPPNTHIYPCGRHRQVHSAGCFPERRPGLWAKTHDYSLQKLSDVPRKIMSSISARWGGGVPLHREC